jgi:uncharacterized protein
MNKIIDGKEPRENTNVPVIAIIFKDSEGLDNTVQYHFSNESKIKLKQYCKIGQRDKILLDTGKILFVRY